jgi:hypothetical protein
LLHKNTATVRYDPQTERYVYQSDSLVGSFDQLRQALRTCTGTLVIGAELLMEPPYPELQTDIMVRDPPFLFSYAF